jgi:hypothetical protein
MVPNDKSSTGKDLEQSGKCAYKPAYKQNSKTDSNPADSMPPELLRISKVWNNLPEHIRQAINALVKPFDGEGQ